MSLPFKFSEKSGQIDWAIMANFDVEKMLRVAPTQRELDELQDIAKRLVPVKLADRDAPAVGGIDQLVRLAQLLQLAYEYRNHQVVEANLNTENVENVDMDGAESTYSRKGYQGERQVQSIRCSTEQLESSSIQLKIVEDLVASAPHEQGTEELPRTDQLLHAIQRDQLLHDIHREQREKELLENQNILMLARARELEEEVQQVSHDILAMEELHREMKMKEQEMALTVEQLQNKLRLKEVELATTLEEADRERAELMDRTEELSADVEVKMSLLDQFETKFERLYEEWEEKLAEKDAELLAGMEQREELLEELSVLYSQIETATSGNCSQEAREKLHPKGLNGDRGLLALLAIMHEAFDIASASSKASAAFAMHITFNNHLAMREKWANLSHEKN
ncbi:hypothetical protein CYMTET_24143 [Cymbomonas tetramitiformis]|uniref:Uncharacterized protein n=1 Tax=Cymbomonas tetramitiformis TaxID=36881 RepID=A0AAE0FWR6_9CHLO|nr:hypothetical protein CYMTET_24143 [Cymbomonas tetramitiformis]